MRSMTGFGRGHASEAGRHVRAEIKTVNHRFFDISIRAPRIMASFEDRIRHEIREHILRGHAEVLLTFTASEASGTTAVVDMAQVELLAKAAQEIASAAGCENGLTAANIMQMDDVVLFEPTETEVLAVQALALSAVREACSEVVTARTLEGDALWSDVLKRAKVLESLVDRINEREPFVVKEYAARLADRIRDLAPDTDPANDSRVAQEVAIFADRCNVSEEVVRIRSHLSRLRKAEQVGGAQGRNLDFLVQELNREFNTIGSKSQDTLLTDFVLDAKAEVEKIREQVQNIE